MVWRQISRWTDRFPLQIMVSEKRKKKFNIHFSTYSKYEWAHVLFGAFAWSGAAPFIRLLSTYSKAGAVRVQHQRYTQGDFRACRLALKWQIGSFCP